MKKFLVILMVVAMAAFLFVGCMPSVTPPVEEEEEEEEEEVAVAKTETPYITNIGGAAPTSISLYSTETQYTNSPTVEGVGVAGAVIKVYINDVQVGVGSSGDGGAIDTISPLLADLTEGVSEIYITATQPGLAESDPSTKYTFTFDETAPSIASVVADSGDNTILVTFDGDVEMSTTTTSDRWLESAMNPKNWTWYNGSGNAASVTANQLLVTTCTIANVSDKAIKITPSATAGIVLDAGTTYYITLLKAEDVTTPTWESVYDKAGNANASDVTYVSQSIP